ncbi:MAG: methyl-accepting chemotaxis protein, partial [Chromatiales bacterium]|nr:methyl-accepting chemotaxis protein [Chromatiales bacterium]
MEGTIGVQAELLAIERMQTHAIDHHQAHDLIAEAQKRSSEAFSRMENSGLISAEAVGRFSNETRQFGEARNKLLETHMKYVDDDKKLNKAFSVFAKFMKSVETIGDSQVEFLETSNDGPFYWEEELAPRWEAADGAMELWIALLERRHAYDQLAENPTSPELVERLEHWYADLQGQVQRLAGLAIYDAVIEEGAFKGKKYADVLKQQIQIHEATFTSAIKSLQQFHQAKEGYNTATDRLLEHAEQIEESGDSAVEGKISEVEGVRTSAISAIVLTLVVGLVVGFLVILYGMKFIARPISNVAEKLREIGNQGGDLTVQLPVKGSDEVADLSQGFNDFVGKIHDIVNQVRVATEQISTAAGQLTLVSDAVSNDVIKQQQETDQVASAMSEMTSTSNDVANSASSTASATAEAESLAATGENVVSDTIASIRRTADQVDQSAEVINQLSAASENIGSVVQVIQSIAEQTNLLALNAAIEAARAGEQGRGFAVVADEVRNLANRTQESTEEIQKTIEELQEGATKASAVMHQGTIEAENSVQQTMKAGESLDGIK